MKKMINLLVVGMLLISSVSFSLIVTSINPYYLLVKEIVGDCDEVSLLLPPNVNPHTYSLKVSDVKMLSKAKIIFANGGIEPDLDKFNVVYLKNYIPDIFVEHQNPHFWLDPYFVKYYIIPTITEKLKEIYPDCKEIFEKNAKLLIENINEFLKEAQKNIDIEGTVLVNHPSFYYFFKGFGLDVKWIEEGHNVSVGMKELLNVIKSENIIALFSEVQQSNKNMEIVSKTLKMKYYILDPLGINAKRFIDIYYSNFEEIRKALKNEK